MVGGAAVLADCLPGPKSNTVVPAVVLLTAADVGVVTCCSGEVCIELFVGGDVSIDNSGLTLCGPGLLGNDIACCRAPGVLPWLWKTGSTGVGAACISSDTPPALYGAEDICQRSSRLCVALAGNGGDTDRCACCLACDTEDELIWAPWARMDCAACCDCDICTGDMRWGVSLPCESVWAAADNGDAPTFTADVVTGPTGEEVLVVGPRDDVCTC